MEVREEREETSAMESNRTHHTGFMSRTGRISFSDLDRR